MALLSHQMEEIVQVLNSHLMVVNLYYASNTSYYVPTIKYRSISWAALPGQYLLSHLWSNQCHRRMLLSYRIWTVDFGRISVPWYRYNYIHRFSLTMHSWGLTLSRARAHFSTTRDLIKWAGRFSAPSANGGVRRVVQPQACRFAKLVCIFVVTWPYCKSVT